METKCVCVCVCLREREALGVREGQYIDPIQPGMVKRNIQLLFQHPQRMHGKTGVPRGKPISQSQTQLVPSKMDQKAKKYSGKKHSAVQSYSVLRRRMLTHSGH